MSNLNSDSNDFRPDFSIEEDDSIPDLPDPSELPEFLIAVLDSSEIDSGQFGEFSARSYRNVTTHPAGILEVRWIEWDFRNDIPGSLELVDRTKDIVVDEWQSPGRGVISDGVATYTYGGQRFSDDGQFFLEAIRGDFGDNVDATSVPNQVRIQLRSRAASWSVVGCVDFPDPSHARNMDAFFEETGNPNVLAFKIEGNWQTTLYFVTWANGELNVSPPIATEDPIPFSFGPVFSPNSHRYLMGDGSFDFGVSCYSWPECEKIGFAEWPKTAAALFIDNRRALIRTKNGKLLVLDTSDQTFTQEWVVGDAEKRASRGRLCNISLSERFLRATFAPPNNLELVHVYADIAEHQDTT